MVYARPATLKNDITTNILQGLEHKIVNTLISEKNEAGDRKVSTVRGLRSPPKFGPLYGPRTDANCQCMRTRFQSVGGRAVGESVGRQVEGKCTVGTEARHRSAHQHAHAETGDVDKRTPNMRRRLNECKTQRQFNVCSVYSRSNLRPKSVQHVFYTPQVDIKTQSSAAIVLYAPGRV